MEIEEQNKSWPFDRWYFVVLLNGLMNFGLIGFLSIAILDWMHMIIQHDYSIDIKYEWMSSVSIYATDLSLLAELI